MNEQDLLFLSNGYADYQLPDNRLWLLKYFSTDLQRTWLKYYLSMGDSYNFIDHTGYFCTERAIYKFQSRLKKLLAAHGRAKSELTEENMEMIYRIESGKFFRKPRRKKEKIHESS